MNLYLYFKNIMTLFFILKIKDIVYGIEIKCRQI